MNISDGTPLDELTLNLPPVEFRDGQAWSGDIRYCNGCYDPNLSHQWPCPRTGSTPEERIMTAVIEDPEAGRITEPGAIVLNEADPIERQLARMVRMLRKKQAMYATRDDVFHNFNQIAAATGQHPLVVCETLLQKHGSVVTDVTRVVARDHAILEREPHHDDAYGDRAVYATIAAALYQLHAPEYDNVMREEQTLPRTFGDPAID